VPASPSIEPQQRQRSGDCTWEPREPATKPPASNKASGQYGIATPVGIAPAKPERRFAPLKSSIAGVADVTRRRAR